MRNLVLWRRLTETDFNAMHGEASPHGRGGGAMHVALGVRTNKFPIDTFLDASGKRNVTIEAAAAPGKGGSAPLTFSSNPSRRGGEWLIRDQFSHRHPAWSPAAGFRAIYNQNDPPYVLIFRVGTTFHARCTDTRRLAKLGVEVIPKEMLLQPKGIALAPATLLSAFNVPAQSLLDTFVQKADEDDVEEFDPASVTDGRERIFAAVIQRLGQQSFRRKLLAAYGARCAVTRCKTVWVLEAAHITPYRGLKTNAISNGLLLRADVHTLFDLALIAIEPSNLKIRVSKLLVGSQYAVFDGKAPALPSGLTVRPSRAALEEHYSQFLQ